MRFYTSVMDCCGILGIQGVTGCTTPEIFWDTVIHVVSAYVPYEKVEKHKFICVQCTKEFRIKGAIVQVNTAHIQEFAEKTLKDIGFIPVMTARNLNSHNDDTVWLMPASTFWDKYAVEVAKKSNWDLFPLLFPEENPNRASKPAPTPKLKASAPTQPSPFVGKDYTRVVGTYNT